MWTSNGPTASLWGLLCCSNRLLWMPRTGRWKVSLASIDVVFSKISSPWLWTPKSWKIPRLCVSSNSSSQVASLQSLHVNLSPSLISDLLPGNWWTSGKGGATWKGWLCMLPTTDPRLNWWRQHYDTKLPRNTTTNLEASVQMKCSISCMITICGFGRTPSITESAQMGTSFWLQIFTEESVFKLEEDELIHQICDPSGRPFQTSTGEIVHRVLDNIRGRRRALPQDEIRRLK